MKVYDKRPGVLGSASTHSTTEANYAGPVPGACSDFDSIRDRLLVLCSSLGDTAEIIGGSLDRFDGSRPYPPENEANAERPDNALGRVYMLIDNAANIAERLRLQAQRISGIA